ncbi:MAG: M48 family metallopeptidase [Candidatus Korobacteraceae bacterium]
MRTCLTRLRSAGYSNRLPGPAIVSLLLLTTAFAAQSPTQIKPGFNLFTKQQDVQLGQEVAAEVRKKAVIVNDPTINAYVNAVGKRLMASHEARGSGFNFTFQVVADPAINAFALPGGPMFINTGLLKAVNNEAELAGVMGHEMSHVILRHGTNQASKAKVIELPLALAGQLTSNGSLMGQLTQLGIDLSEDSVLLKFSRTAEGQADLMGAHLMSEAGYDPIQLAKFFDKLNARGGASSIEFLSDHPNPDNRSRAIRQEAARLPDQQYGYQTGQFQQMKRAVANIHEPSPKQKSE